MSPQVSSVCCSAFYQLRQLRLIVHSLTTDAAKMVIQAFVSLRLDYCNSLCYGISDRLIRRLQAIQNAAARLVTGMRRRDHISPVLRHLHWLPVHQHIKFKLAVLVYKSLYGLAPQYLVENCELVAAAASRQLRSSDIATFVVPRTYNSSGRSGISSCWTTAVEQPSVQPKTVWPTLQQFRRVLKTYLFGWLRLQHLVTFVCTVLHECSYLLTYLYMLKDHLRLLWPASRKCDLILTRLWHYINHLRKDWLFQNKCRCPCICLYCIFTVFCSLSAWVANKSVKKSEMHLEFTVLSAKQSSRAVMIWKYQ